ncbi:MAG: recombination protein RecR [Candidatus Wildermuthbacteria bacterium]|nr:recombination protein RecR [Candidatus Wildermuthbacteria bacterium]
MYPKTIRHLIELFSKFPTVGPRTAARFVFYLLKAPEKEVQQLIEGLEQLKKQVRLCAFCFNPFDAAESNHGELDPICADSSRDTSLLCIVEKESDLEALEKTKTYHGLYFILGGTVGMLRKEDLNKLRMEALRQRIENPSQFGIARKGFKEIIIAVNPTTEGVATALYIERTLKSFSGTITRLGRGLPVGGEIEYADEETLRNALERRH